MSETGRIAVAMSGGVDSSVAAHLLRSIGEDVVGFTLRIWDCETPSARKVCCGIEALEQARNCAARIGIPHYVLDARDIFEGEILRPAWDDYARGRTPNPCIRCNELVKFGMLLEKARTIDSTRVATGHHARVAPGPGGSLALRRGHDGNKDQSYFLFSLSQEQLQRAVFPVGDLTKSEVREIAKSLGLSNADREESQDACILSDEGSFAEALRQRFNAVVTPGNFVDTEGRVLGEHSGIHNFTIGQRRGLGISLGKKVFVSRIDADRNEVVLSSEESELLATGLEAIGLRWSTRSPSGGAFDAQVQIRYRHKPTEAKVEPVGADRALIRFSSPQRAVAPGQAVVIYDGDLVVGGGWMDRALPCI